MTIEVLPSAKADLLAGFHFYERQEEGLGEEFIACLFDDIDALEYQAGIHVQRHGHFRKLCSRFPYGIYYLTDGETVWVDAVLDGRQDPEWIRRRLFGEAC
jgi:plasmid stabilization system protein ParE